MLSLVNPPGEVQSLAMVLVIQTLHMLSERDPLWPSQVHHSSNSSFFLHHCFSLLNHSLKKILLLVYKYTVILPQKIDNSLFILTLLLVTTPFSTSLHSKTLRKQLSIQYLAISNFSTSILLSPFQSGFYPNTLPKLLLSSHKESNSHSQFSSYLTYQQHLKQLITSSSLKCFT